MLWARVRLVGPVLPLYIFGHFAHHAAIGSLVPLMPWLRDAYDLDYARSGILISALSLSYGFGQLPMSALGDRFSKTALTGFGLIGAAIAALAVSLSSGFYLLFAFLIILGLFGSTYHAPTSSFLSQWFSQQARGRALGIHAIGGSAGLISTPVAAVLIARFSGDWRYSFTALAIPALLVGSSISLAGRKWENTSLAKLAAGPKERVSVVEISRLIGILLAMAVLSQSVVTAINSFLPLYLVDSHGVPREVAGMMVGLAAGAGILGAPLGGSLSDRFGRKPMIVASVALTGPAIILLTVVPFGILMVGVIILFGLTWSMRMPVIESLIADTVPWHRRASVLGLYFFVSQETSGVTTPLVGWLIDSFGLNSVFSALGLVASAFSILMLLIRKRV